MKTNVTQRGKLSGARTRAIGARWQPISLIAFLILVVNRLVAE